MNKRIPILVIASALALSACGSSTPTVSMDYPTYSTVAELDRVADVVVLGQIGARTSTEYDNGGNEEVGDEGQPLGIPMAFFDFTVQKVLQGDLTDKTITVEWIDTSKVTLEDSTSDLKQGQTVVLWLQHLTTQDAPGGTSVSDFWVPVSGDNGVMDVAAGHATARSETLTGLKTPGQERLSISQEALAAALAS